jgi:hypothetical protein
MSGNKKGTPAQADKAHRAKVHSNENEVIAGSARLNPDDKSDAAEQIREAAEDIIARRAASN